MQKEKTPPPLIAQDIKNAYDLTYEPTHRNSFVIATQTSLVTGSAAVELPSQELLEETVKRHLWIWLMVGIQIGSATDYPTIGHIPVSELSKLHIEVTQDILSYSPRLLDYVIDDVPILCARLRFDEGQEAEIKLAGLTNRICEAGLIASRRPKLLSFQIETR